MRTLANLSIDALLNLLFGWRNDVRSVELIVIAESPTENKIIKSLAFGIERIRQKEGFNSVISNFCREYFWYEKVNITRFVVYLSSTVYMQNGNLRHLPFIAFGSDTPKEIMDKTVQRWHGKRTPRPQGFFISLDKLGSGFSGICYLPLGLLSDKPLTERVLPKDVYAVKGIKRIKHVGVGLSDDLIPLAVLSRDEQNLSTIEIIGDYGEAVPTERLADDSGLNPQLALFADS